MPCTWIDIDDNSAPALLQKSNSLFLYVGVEDGVDQSFVKNLKGLTLNFRAPIRVLFIMLNRNTYFTVSYLDLLEQFWQKQLIEVTIIGISSSVSKHRHKIGIMHRKVDYALNIYQYNPFTRAYTNQPLDSSSIVFPTKLNDLHGHELRLGFVQNPLQSLHGRNSQKIEAFVDQLLSTIQRKLNFSVELDSIPISDVSHLLHNDSISDAVQEIISLRHLDVYASGAHLTYNEQPFPGYFVLNYRLYFYRKVSTLLFSRSHKLGKKAVQFTDKVTCLDWLLNYANVSCVMGEFRILALLSRYSKWMKLANPCFWSTYQVLVMRQGSPYTPSFNRIIRVTQESGIARLWKNSQQKQLHVSGFTENNISIHRLEDNSHKNVFFLLLMGVSVGHEMMKWIRVYCMGSFLIAFVNSYLWHCLPIAPLISQINARQVLFLYRSNNQKYHSTSELSNYMSLSLNFLAPVQVLLIMFNSKNDSSGCYPDLLEKFCQKQLLDVTIISISLRVSEDRKIGMISYEMDYATAIHHYNPFARVYTNQNLNSSSRLFPTKLDDLHAYKLRVGFLEDLPYSLGIRKTEDYKGIFDSVLDLIESKLNFSVEPDFMMDYAWQNDSITGLQVHRVVSTRRLDVLVFGALLDYNEYPLLVLFLYRGDHPKYQRNSKSSEEIVNWIYSSFVSRLRCAWIDIDKNNVSILLQKSNSLFVYVGVENEIDGTFITNLKSLSLNFPAPIQVLLIIFNSKNDSSESYLNLLEQFWQKQLLDVTIISISSQVSKFLRKIGTISYEMDYAAKIHHYNPFANVYTNQNLDPLSRLFPVKLDDLQGYRLRVGFLMDVPYSLGSLKSDEDEGIFDTVLHLIKDKLNFSIESDFMMDYPLFNDSVTRLCVQRIVSERRLDALVFGALIDHHEQPLLVDRTTFISWEQTCALVPLMRKPVFHLNNGIKWWLLVILSLVAVVWLSSLLLIRRRGSSSYWRPLNICLMMMGSPITAQAVTLRERFLFGSVLLLSLFYSSSILVHLTNLKLDLKAYPSFKTYQELDESGLIPVVDPYWFNMTFRFSNDPALNRLGEKAFLSSERRTCVYWLLNYANVSCILGQHYIRLYTAMFSGKMKQAEPCFWSTYRAFIVRKGSPYLPSFNRIIHAAYESGKVQSFWQHYYEFIAQLRNEHRVNVTGLIEENSLPDKLRNNSYRNVFFLLFAGYLLSLAVFFIELAFNNFHTKLQRLYRISNGNE
uniref:Ionotropic glutamate receptor C-terminal domain-containing protein n=1 Tax=Trichogramma kaykai TaxID=54128 RepID=A0ABD2XP10_9HYME